MILIVDDHDDCRKAIALLLRLEGFETAMAASGEEALQFLSSNRPHCILLDYNMAGIDGLEVLRRVRSDRNLESLRVIMFSAHGNDLKAKAMAAGADGFVQKASLDFAELLRQLVRHCQPTTEPAPFELPDPPSQRDAG